MKRIFAALLLVVVMFSFVTYAGAEDLTELTTEELLAMREEINEELAARYEPPVLEDGMTLIDIFPDKNFAIYIRDQVGAFSINDQVTQADLDRVDNIFINSESFGITSLEGLQYLTNLQYMTCITQRQLTEFPDCFDDLPNLHRLDLSQCSITELPPSICNAPLLYDLDVGYTMLTKLPEDIGNMPSLKKLDISNTQIKELPASIRLLQLEEFNRRGLDLGD